MKELHTNDLSMNSGKLFREQMVENFKAIEQVINDIYGEIDKLNNRISDVEEKLKKLESSDINTEYITDTNISTDTTTDVPISIDVNDTNNSDDHFQETTIK
ncbi:hypothetical protein [Limosilactobacillus reuteri]|uniref:hypothetical protein n=1 Tax=Limosilactobacillus reuteri TaxID=1598 RepID=UPI0015DEA8F0|nr:hypothetical protein [Limosilactobacillus reuteri]MDW5473211.1 hypothetical protein [Limosilactobacillus reuteri]WLC96619.1 hypothetical protein LDE72_04450 [Limosilactobacillus reuteri]WRH78790.1 hypothetical protein QM199_02860 [Limosilactobacillus reuteri]